MPDILDIIFATKKAEGIGATLATQAAAALKDANDAVSAVDGILSDAQAAKEAAETAAGTYDNLATAVETEVTSQLSPINTSISNLEDNAITNIETQDDNTAATKIKKIKYRKKNIDTALAMVKNYTSTGNNEDGSMTQKAISDELSNLQTQINNIDVSSLNMGADNAGSIVSVGDDGSLQPSPVQENQIIEALIKTDSYSATNAVGVIIDYENKTVIRTQDSIQYTAGADFNKYNMYGGRRRCNVNNSGQIVAWFGDSGFRDDGSNGDVMVYQPKFYYQRIPTKTTAALVGSLIQKETLLLSDIEQVNFKLHPAFYDTNGHEIDYILLPAYEGCTYDVSASSINSTDAAGIDFDNDVLHSYGGVKPVSGLNNNLTIINAEKLAQNHGTGWHITTAQALSVNQMLAIVEFGTLNIQNGIENGLSNLPDSTTTHTVAQTGSTSSLGNSTGAATSTTVFINNTPTNYTIAGTRAISYRGVENPFGNIWQFIGNTKIVGNGNLNGGVLYLCNDFNYDFSSAASNYTNTNLILPNSSGWVSYMSYSSSTYDWLFIPGSNTGNSTVPVGDYVWITNNLNGNHSVVFGGSSTNDVKNGMFYYNFDQIIDISDKRINARLVHIPTYNSIIYNANKISWTTQIGG